MLEGNGTLGRGVRGHDGRDSQVTLALGLGEAQGEFIQVAGGDQPSLGGVIAWRQCPVVPGGLAVPDSPPRVLAP